MRAIVYTRYGPPEVVKLTEVAKPTPKDNEVLIKVHATTVNRTDCGFRKAEYFAVRVVGGLFKPKNKILGTELAGVVESIGKDVKTFSVGDKVFGLSTFKFGTHADYVCVPEEKAITPIPVNLDFNKAAAVPEGMFLAYNYIKRLDYSTPKKVLVNGASGSIGSATVQLAKYFGAHVTAVCKTSAVELVKSLGADRVIDYTKDDFTKENEQYDAVFDSVGKSSFFKCKHLLKPKAFYTSTELGNMWQNVWLALLAPLMPGKKAIFPIPVDTKKDMLFFKQIIEEGKYKPVIDRTYPLEQIIDAYNYVETGEKTGNVVITL